MKLYEIVIFLLRGFAHGSVAVTLNEQMGFFLQKFVSESDDIFKKKILLHWLGKKLDAEYWFL